MTALLLFVLLLALVVGVYVFALDWRHEGEDQALNLDDIEPVTYGPGALSRGPYRGPYQEPLTDEHGSYIERIERDAFRRTIQDDDSP